MKIEIIGMGCAKCKKLYDNTLAAILADNLQASVDKITDINEIASKGVLLLPAFIIDGRVVSCGKVLSVDEVRRILRKPA